MFLKLLDNLNFIAGCKKYKIGLWQCPNFLFLVMGLLTIASMFGTYFASKSFDNETVAIVGVAIVAAIIVTVGSFVVRGVEKIAEANVIKNEFISVVSHQLCGPLSSIRWNMEVLETDSAPEHLKPSPKQMVFLKNIKSANDKMLKLVNQLLEVNRIDEGREIFHDEKADVGAITDQAISELNDLVEERKVEIVKRIAPDLPPVYADASALKTVIRNLVSNAVKYSREKGKVEVDIKPEGKKMLLVVRVWGGGIPGHRTR